MIESWKDLTTEGKATFPFPTEPLEITFGLTDETAPDAVTLTFTPLTQEEIAGIAATMAQSVESLLTHTEQVTRGMGGDARTDAIKAVYRDEIAGQANLTGLMQSNLNAVVRSRYRMEILRRMAGAQGE